jgi:hypothetical protein
MILDAINLVKDVLFVTFINAKKVAERIKQKRATRVNIIRPLATSVNQELLLHRSALSLHMYQNNIYRDLHRNKTKFKE